MILSNQEKASKCLRYLLATANSGEGFDFSNPKTARQLDYFRSSYYNAIGHFKSLAFFHLLRQEDFKAIEEEGRKIYLQLKQVKESCKSENAGIRRDAFAKKKALYAELEKLADLIKFAKETKAKKEFLREDLVNACYEQVLRMEKNYPEDMEKAYAKKIRSFSL